MDWGVRSNFAVDCYVNLTSFRHTRLGLYHANDVVCLFVLPLNVVILLVFLTLSRRGGKKPSGVGVRRSWNNINHLPEVCQTKDTHPVRILKGRGRGLLSN